MSFDLSQLRSYVIIPALTSIGLYSLEAEQQLLGTCAQESKFGTYLHQVGLGPALGIFQMEPKTHDSLLNDFLKYKPKMLESIMLACRFNRPPVADQLIHNLFYATIMCRIHYLRTEEVTKKPIPKTLEGQADYWDRYYNVDPVRGARIKEYIGNYNKYAKGGPI
ncbi:MAG: hypothetical protein ACHP9Y_01315 [Gammaproteobacteria bacterium]